MKKKALTLTEVLIAISIGIVLFLPTSIMFSNSAKVMEKSSNLTFAGGLSRHIIQKMMTMRMNDIQEIDYPGISFCDDSDDNVYFKDLFDMAEDCGELKKGKISISMEKCPKLYARLARYNYRYYISIAQISDPIVKNVAVCVTWEEFGEHKILKTNAYIIPR